MSSDFWMGLAAGAGLMLMIIVIIGIYEPMPTDFKEGKKHER